MVRLFYVSIDKQVGGAATAGAVKTSPAVPALLPSIDVQACKFRRAFTVKCAVVDASKPVCFIAHKLVAGVDIPFRRDRHIFAAA